MKPPGKGPAAAAEPEEGKRRALAGQGWIPLLVLFFRRSLVVKRGWSAAIAGESRQAEKRRGRRYKNVSYSCFR